MSYSISVRWFSIKDDNANNRQASFTTRSLHTGHGVRATLFVVANTNVPIKIWLNRKKKHRHVVKKTRYLL